MTHVRLCCDHGCLVVIRPRTYLIILGERLYAQTL
jgi:hypothetical protein